MMRRQARQTTLAVALVIALCVLPGLGFAVNAWQAGEIFSPASGHAQTIAQGVAVVPSETAWRAVFHSFEPGLVSELPAAGPGFILVNTGGVLVDGGAGTALLAPSEASFQSGVATRLTPVGERPVGLFAIDLVPPGAVDDAGQGIPVYASAPFAAPAGARDIDLVRDLLEPGESTTVIGNEAPVLLLVTLGAVRAEATDGSAASLRVGEAATFSGDVVITAEGQAPATFVAAVIGREAPVAAGTPGATPAPVSVGSVQATVYACPPLVAPGQASSGNCLRDPEAVALRLVNVDGESTRDVGPSSERQGLPTWSGLPAGDYVLQATGFGAGFARFFVPGLEAVADGGDDGVPASETDGYRLAISDDAVNYALDVFVFGPGAEGTPVPAAAGTSAPPQTAAPTGAPPVIIVEGETPVATTPVAATSTPQPSPTPTATPRPTARAIVTTTAVARPSLGSIDVRVWGCLDSVDTFNPANCAQAVDGFDIQLINEDGEIIPLTEATPRADGSLSWEDLPLGTYLFQQPLLLPGTVTYYVPDLPLNVDGTGYVVSIESDAPVASIDVYSLPPPPAPTPAPTPVAPLDTDVDGLPDADETAIHGTDPTSADSDLDGISDGAELAAGTNPLAAETAPPIQTGGDSDADRLADAAEATQGTDPNNPDSDGDGYYDGDEVNLGTAPLDPASFPAG